MGPFPVAQRFSNNSPWLQYVSSFLYSPHYSPEPIPTRLAKESMAPFLEPGRALRRLTHSICHNLLCVASIFVVGRVRWKDGRLQWGSERRVIVNLVVWLMNIPSLCPQRRSRGHGQVRRRWKLYNPLSCLGGPELRIVWRNTTFHTSVV